MQVILQEEAHLTEVIDPAGGAYAVEALTDQLARRAWALFREVGHKGGMAEVTITVTSIDKGAPEDLAPLNLGATAGLDRVVLKLQTLSPAGAITTTTVISGD